MSEKSRAVPQRYETLNGLRAFAAIGIILMHVKANLKTDFGNAFINDLVTSFTTFVYLFMMVSAFSMCCGYLNKFNENRINLTEFYKKRYMRILPYFAFLVLIDVIISHNLTAVIDGFADVTLLFGLLPNNDLSVIGVGWFLGVVFLFYIMFPFFCFLLHKKSFAWFWLAVTVLLNICCTFYFFNSDNVGKNFSARHNFLYCMMFFVAGGIIYLYKDSFIPIVHKLRYAFLALSVGEAAVFMLFREWIYKTDYVSVAYMIIFATWIIYAVSTNGIILNNKVTKFLSDISMEMYLSHMIMYRLVEKFNLLYIFGKSTLSYITVSVIVLVLTIVFSLCTKYVILKGVKIFKSKFSKSKQ